MRLGIRSNTILAGCWADAGQDVTLSSSLHSPKSRRSSTEYVCSWADYHAWTSEDCKHYSRGFELNAHSRMAACLGSGSSRLTGPDAW